MCKTSAQTQSKMVIMYACIQDVTKTKEKFAMNTNVKMCIKKPQLCPELDTYGLHVAD